MLAYGAESDRSLGIPGEVCCLLLQVLFTPLSASSPGIAFCICGFIIKVRFMVPLEIRDVKLVFRGSIGKFLF